MIIRENSDYSIPVDLIIEILSRSSAKTIAKYRCVSKLWASILRRPYFTRLFLTCSLARPRLLIVLQRGDEWYFLTALQPHNPYGKSSSLVVAADFHMKFPQHLSPEFYGIAFGLIYFHHMLQISQGDIVPVPMICNPSTGQYLSLPNASMKRYWRSFLGFDPVDKKIKVLSIDASLYDGKESPQILTLGTGNFLWRKIHCPFDHFSTREGVCINGVLYYLGIIRFGLLTRVIVCFDFRSEKFRFIDNELFGNQSGTKLINYKGKLGWITWSNCELHMWVINNVDKPEEVSHYSYIFSERGKVVDGNVSVAGVTALGEIVLSVYNPSKPFYVLYVNLERNTLRSVEIQGLGANHEAFKNFSRLKVFVGHVENLNFIKN